MKARGTSETSPLFCKRARRAAPSITVCLPSCSRTSSGRSGIVNPGMVNTSFFDELDFRPGDEEDQHLVPNDVVEAVLLMLAARPGAVVQEINLQPQKRVIRFD